MEAKRRQIISGEMLSGALALGGGEEEVIGVS